MQQAQAATAPGGVGPHGLRWSRRSAIGVAAAVVAAVLCALTLVASEVGDLPGRVAGLPRVSEPDADVDRAVASVVQRLESEPAVERVAVERYGEDGAWLVVMLVAPRRPLGEDAAGELTARVMAAVLPVSGEAATSSSVVSRDGAALVTCSTRRPGAATCLTVDPHHAVLVLSSGVPGDSAALAETVRADVLDLPAP